MALTKFQKFVRLLLSSFGLKRTLSAAFQTLSLVISTIPQLAPFALVLGQIAAWFGIAGLAHAAVADTATPPVPQAKVISLATLAAFFVAASQVAERISVLQPYAPLFLFLANLFSTVTVGVGTVEVVKSIKAK